MTPREWFFGAAAAAVLFVPAIVAADELDQTVRGRLAAVDTSSGARGEFRLEVRTHSNQVVETMALLATRLGATADAQGNRPSYHAVLINSGGTTTADFGEARLNRNGVAFLRFNSRHDNFPSGVTTLTAFGGGTFELQRDGAAVLRGNIPAFVTLGGASSPGSFASFHGTARLNATVNGAAGRGAIEARAANGPNRSVQHLRIAVRLLGTLGNPFTVVAIDSSHVETTLGTITTRGRLGSGSLNFDSRRGTPIPTGDLSGLAGMTIEVRNASGTAVLTGNFPSIP